MINSNIKLYIFSVLVVRFFNSGIICSKIIENVVIMSTFFGTTCL